MNRSIESFWEISSSYLERTRQRGHRVTISVDYHREKPGERAVHARRIATYPAADRFKYLGEIASRRCAFPAPAECEWERERKRRGERERKVSPLTHYKRTLASAPPPPPPLFLRSAAVAAPAAVASAGCMPSTTRHCKIDNRAVANPIAPLRERPGDAYYFDTVLLARILCPWYPTLWHWQLVFFFMMNTIARRW